MSDALRIFAEDFGRYVAPSGPERLHEDPAGRFAIFFGPGSDPVFTSVFSLRLDEDGVGAALEEVRSLVRAAGRTGATWEVAPHATPPDLARRLVEQGLAPFEENPVAKILVLTEPPDGSGDGDVEIRRVQTFEDYRASQQIAFAAFGRGFEPEELQDEALRPRFEADAAAGDRALFLAIVDGRPAAQGMALFASQGVALAGGSTLPEARGRGAYRAVVQARWDEAVRRGTPLLVTHAGPMSRPILERLGFREIGEIHVLLDAEI
jgi:hypothetical protein